ncbi:hypothetical protein [Teredinibacter turnerae]|uniref:hypothetical protein n=1 Tax=Teredinibacter turnerae TaxID=2426 RepID=UPI0030CAE33C
MTVVAAFLEFLFERIDCSPFLGFFLSLMCLYKFRRRVFLFCIYFFIFSFYFDFSLTLISGVPLFWGYQKDLIPLTFFLINFFLSLSLLLYSPLSSMKFRELEEFYSPLACWMLLFLGFVGLFFLKGENIFSSVASYSAYQKNLANASGLNEYLIMLAILLLFFKKNFLLRVTFVFFIGLYIVKSIGFGFRVQSLMMLLVLFVAIARGDLKPLYTVSLASLGFVLMLLVGFLKEGESIENFGLHMLIDDRNGYAQSHQHGVLSASSVILKHYDKELVVRTAFGVGGAVVASIIPRRFVNDAAPWAYPSTFAQSFQYTPGGGFFVVQIVFLLGPFLGCLFLFGILWVLNCVARDDFVRLSVYGRAFGVVLFIFFPRWISYDFFNYAMRTGFLLLVTISLYLFLRSVCDAGKARR